MDVVLVLVLVVVAAVVVILYTLYIIYIFISIYIHIYAYHILYYVLCILFKFLRTAICSVLIYELYKIISVSLAFEVFPVRKIVESSQIRHRRSFSLPCKRDRLWRRHGW